MKQWLFMLVLFISGALAPKAAAGWYTVSCSPEHDDTGYTCSRFNEFLDYALTSDSIESREILTRVELDGFDCEGQFEIQLVMPLKTVDHKALVTIDFYLRRLNQLPEDHSYVALTSWTDTFFPRDISDSLHSRDSEVNPAIRALLGIRSRLNSLLAHQHIKEICGLSQRRTFQ